MKTIIGLIGEKGAGKETFTTLLKQLLPDKKIVTVSTSKLLAQTLDLWTLPHTRENLQDMAILMEEVFGEGTLNQAIKGQIEEAQAEIVVFDNIRWGQTFDFIKSLPESLTVYITANAQIRWERVTKRPEKIGEDKISFEKFQQNAAQKTTETEVPGLGEQADIKLENNGSLEDFKQQIHKFLNRFAK